MTTHAMLVVGGPRNGELVTVDRSRLNGLGVVVMPDWDLRPIAAAMGLKSELVETGTYHHQAVQVACGPRGRWPGVAVVHCLVREGFTVHPVDLLCDNARKAATS